MDYVKTADQHFKKGLYSVLVAAVFLFCAVYTVYVVFVKNVCWGFLAAFCFLNESLSFSELHHFSEAHTGQSGVSMLQMSQQI